MSGVRLEGHKLGQTLIYQADDTKYFLDLAFSILNGKGSLHQGFKEFLTEGLAFVELLGEFFV